MTPLRRSLLATAGLCALIGWPGSRAVGAPAPAAPPAAFEPIEPLPSAPPPRAPRAPKDVAEAPPDAEKSASGLASKRLAKGSGESHPGPYDKVTVHYTGWTRAGKMFDSTIPGGEPATLALDAPTVIKGWREGLQLMTKGERRRFWVPAPLAYGERSTGPDAPAGDVVFDIELLDYVSVTPPPPAPADVDAAPRDARKTTSGLAYKILVRGKGKERPKASSFVEVHYTGWTPDGKMFDSSIVRGKPTSFPLDGVIKGWTEGVQLMVVGDKARFWIPAALAYGDKPKGGAPGGPLVFDIELLSIK